VLIDDAHRSLAPAEVFVTGSPIAPHRHTVALARPRKMAKTHPVVTGQPLSQTVTAGTEVQLTVTARGNPAPRVRWQTKAADSKSWSSIAGATLATLTLTPTLAVSGSKYRAILKNSAGTATSKAATLTVRAPSGSSGQAGGSGSGAPSGGSGTQSGGTGANTQPVSAIITTWNTLGGAASFLGTPTTGVAYIDPVTQWIREDFQGGAIFIAPDGHGGTQPVALGTTLLAQWQASGGASGSLGLPVSPPAWAGTMGITTLTTAGQQTTTGGHNGQVAFFQNGLIYTRTYSVTGSGPLTVLTDVMTYDTPELGYDTSARYRLQLLDQFTDNNGLVIVDYNLPPGTSLNPQNPIADHPIIDTDDSAWMSGQAVAALAMDGDLVGAQLVLSGIVNNDWSPAGDLIRYPGNTDPFDGLDPATQIAGAYFAWKFANAAGNQEVQSLAQQLIAKWIDEIYTSNGTLGLDGPKVLLPALIELDEVATTIGVDQTRLDNLNQLLNEQKLAVAVASFGTLSGVAVLDNTTLYALCDAFEAGLDDTQLAALGLPTWIQVDLTKADLPIPPFDQSGLNLMFWENLVMHDIAPSAMLNLVTTDLASITASYDLPFQWLDGSPSGLAETQAYVANAGANADSYDGPVGQNPYLGNYWWRTDDRSGPGTSDLQVIPWGNGSTAPTSGNNAVFIGIDNNNLLHIRVFDDGGDNTDNLFSDVVETQLPSTEDAAIATLKQQIQALSTPTMLTDAQKAQFVAEVASILGQPNGAVPVITYNRVDYLVARGLFNLDSSVWLDAPDHIGISVNLPVPEIGSIGVSGYVDSDGTFSLSGAESVSPGGFPLEDAKATITNSGFMLMGDVLLPGNIGMAQVSGSVNENDGTFSLTGSANLSFDGFSIANASVTVGNTEATVSGDIDLPNVGYCSVSGAVYSDGDFSLTGYGALSPGGFTFAGASVTVNNTEATISGNIDLPNVGYCSISGAVYSNGDFSLTGYGALSPGGFTIAGASVTVNNTGATISGNIDLPNVGYCSVSGAVYSNGDFSLTGYGALSPGGFTIAGASVTVNNTEATVSGNIDLPNVGYCSVSGAVYSNGDFSLTGYGALSPGGFTIAGASVTVNNIAATVSGDIDLPNVGYCSVSGSVSSNGYFSLTGYDELSADGFALTSTTVTISSNVASISGNMNLPGLGSVSLQGTVDTSGNFFMTANQNLAPGGFNLANTTVTVQNSGIMVTGTLYGPADLWAQVSGSINADGSFSLTGDASASLGGDLAGGNASFTFSGDASGNVSLGIQIGANFSIDLGGDGDPSISGSINASLQTSDSSFNSIGGSVNANLSVSAFGYSVSTGFSSVSVNGSGFSFGIGEIDFGYFYSVNFGSVNVYW
jgi:Immunoglobulin I-set domain